MIIPEKFYRVAFLFVIAGIAVALQGSGIRDQGSRLNAPPLSHSPIPSTRSEQVENARLGEIYGKLPLSFEQNQGQVDGKVKFLSRGSGYTMFLTANEAVLTLNAKTGDRQDVRGLRRRPSCSRIAVLRMKLLGANPSPEVTALEDLPGKTNYFIGSDPAKWRTNVPTYARVKYRDVYPGIDLVYYGNQRQLEYDWIVSPGADPDAIKFVVEGARRMKVDPNGDLVLAVGGGEVRLQKPVVYQETNGVRQEIAGGFSPRNSLEVGFSLGDYDPTRPLVLDPVLVYSTYLGGGANSSSNDSGRAIAVDSSGNAYVAGSAQSIDFPTALPRQPVFGGSYEDAFVTKFNPSGNTLIYSTYHGGDGNDAARGIAVNSSGYAYVTGYTFSTNFPTFSPRQATRAGNYDAFVTVFNSSGSALFYSTYHGGTGEDDAYGIALDASGNAYVTGGTKSGNFPTFNPRQPNNAGGPQDAFVTKFNSAGSALVYSTYHGGSGDDYGSGIAVDSSGNAYVTGATESANFPIASARQPTYGGGLQDAFVTKFTQTGSAFVYSTYHGGSVIDWANGIAVDSSGNAYVVGTTYSSNFPTANAVQPAHSGVYRDGFVTKFNAAGSTLVYSTFLGGNGDDVGTGIAVDSSGNAYTTGFTLSTDFPTINPIQSFNAGASDAFVTKFNPTGSFLVYSTYFGGTASDVGLGIATNSAGNVHAVGYTYSTDFPTANPVQSSNERDSAAFVIKIREETLGVSPTTVAAGGSVTATWANIGNPTASDWIGLYASSGADDLAQLSYRYTNGEDSGNSPFNIPLSAAAGTTYELRLFSTNTFARLATSNSFTVGMTTNLNVTPATVSPGGSVTATWANIANPSTNDWLGLYASSGADNFAYLSYRDTNGQASSNMPFTVPNGTLAGTTYELRLFSNNSFTRLATSNSFAVQATTTTLSVSPTTVSPGDSVTATWDNIPNPAANDWIGLYASTGADNFTYLSYRTTNGQTSSNLPFTIPAGAQMGTTYELRLFSNNTFTRLATSNAFTVLSATTLSVTPTTVSAGGSVTATWTNIPSPTPNDWIGLYALSGAGNFAQLSIRYTTGDASGNLPFIVPAGTPAGTTYELRLFSNNSFTRLATSNSFTVQVIPTLSVSPSTVLPGGSVTATWANIASPAANDWLGLYSTPGAADSAYLSWRYTNGLASSNVPFTLPAGVAAGATYELRLFNSGQRRATSNSFTIQAITLSVSPTTVFPGGSITATWANIASPTANDWLGLYSWAGAVDNAYLSWRYTNGLASSNVSFTIPGGASAGATYELRLFNNGVRRATSNSFTIQVTTLSVSPTSVFPGAAVPATWANIASPTANDWLGLYSSPGAADNTYLSWRYTNGLASSNVPFTIPAGAAAGATYELRLFSNGVRRATSNKFTIQVTTLSVSPTTVFPGESVTATWANVAGATANDWLGLYSSSGAANNAYLSWRYTDGLVSSNLAFTIPAGAAAGATYELRLFSNGGRRATSNSFTIQAPMSPKTGPITGQ